jgi:hypothetical protein
MVTHGDYVSFAIPMSRTDDEQMMNDVSDRSWLCLHDQHVSLSPLGVSGC